MRHLQRLEWKWCRAGTIGGMFEIASSLLTQVQEPADEGEEGHFGDRGDERSHDGAAPDQVRQAEVRPDQVSEEEAVV